MKWLLPQFLTRSIRRKLLISFCGILSLGVAAVVWISTGLQIQDSRLFILEGVSESSRLLSQQFAREVQQTLNRARGWVVQNGTGTQLAELISGDSAILGIEVLDANDGKVSLSGFQKNLDLKPEQMNIDPSLWKRVQSEGREVYSSTRWGEQLAHLVISPLVKDGAQVKKLMAVFFDPAVLNSSFRSDGTKEAYLFDGDGNILFRSQSIPGEGLGAQKKVPSKLLEMVRANPLTNNQLSLHSEDASARTFIGNYYKSGVADVTVAVFTPEARIYDTPRKIAIRSAYLGLAILSLAMVFAIFFGDSLIKPILALVEATKRIADGDFAVRAVPSTRDELHTLSSAFNEMAAGIQERERLKTLFGKFHSKAVVQKLLQEEKLHLGGERIPVTIFFSDIRSFTSSSEKMSPEAVVEMLNEYMSEMVAVIEKWGGVVDKYVGDAIMAIWGMPTPEPADDALRAVSACLEMREALASLNERRRARGQPAIAIGMGLNHGEVVAGNIGSPSRMEYTVIGDAVNTASRMESLTKDFHTDFLLHDSVARLLPAGEFALSAPMEASAKGKAEKMRIFGCSGRAEGELKAA